MLYSATISIMIKACRKAARGLMKDFGEIENLQVSRKGPGDFFSNADLSAERILVSELERARPGYGFLLEESGEIKGKDAEYRWIIDPLDGTTNYLHALPIFCISLALEKQLPNGKREIVAAVIDDPCRKETFWAEKGSGAWLESSASGGNQRMRVASRKSLKDSLIAMSSFKRQDDVFKKKIDTIVAEGATIRDIGSAALSMAYVAAGKLDGFIQVKGFAWDVAAGVLLVKEAGGVVTNLNGVYVLDKECSMVAGNEPIHREIIKS